MRRSKFTLQAISSGDYFFINYNLLSLLSQYDATMKAIVGKYSKFVKEEGLPECDFKVYREKKNMREIFVQALRRQVLLNMKKRSNLSIRTSLSIFRHEHIMNHRQAIGGCDIRRYQRKQGTIDYVNKANSSQKILLEHLMMQRLGQITTLQKLEGIQSLSRSQDRELLGVYNYIHDVAESYKRKMLYIERKLTSKRKEGN